MHPESISKLISDILRIEGWNQEVLASEIGVTQPAIARWKNERSTPRPRHLSKLLEIHAEAVAHQWACNQFVPLCAFAESYPSELRDLATQALDEMLDFGSLIAPLNVRGDNFSIDLHIRPAKLPKYVSAYTLTNNLRNPTVFVVLVQKELSLADQRRIAWEEIYAHVASRDEIDSGSHSLAASKRPLPVSNQIVQHFRPERSNDNEGTKDKD
jgi:transcriptional regulator with XRE-family HTH domain